MHTARSLTVSPSVLCSGGGVPVRGAGLGGCLFGGLVWGGAWSGGCLLQGGAWSGGCLVRGMPAWSRGEVVSQHGRPPPVNRMTDRCKNITLHQTSFAGGKNISSNPLPVCACSYPSI